MYLTNIVQALSICWSVLILCKFSSLYKWHEILLSLIMIHFVCTLIDNYWFLTLHLIMYMFFYLKQKSYKSKRRLKIQQKQLCKLRETTSHKDMEIYLKYESVSPGKSWKRRMKKLKVYMCKSFCFAFSWYSFSIVIIILILRLLVRYSSV